MKIFFLLNPSRRKKQWDYRAMGAQIARRHGCAARFGEVDRRDAHSTEHLLRQAAEEGCSRIGILGGDGTLHRAINVLYRQKRLNATELAILPAGTCNDFARSLGLRRRRLADAFRMACTGKAKATDLGAMNSELFINNAGVGRRPTAPRSAQPLRTLRNFRALPMRLQWEKGSIDGAFFMAMACNAPYFSGGFHFSKRPQVDDGYLDVYALPALGKWTLAPLWLAGKLGRPMASRRLITLRVRKLVLNAGADLWPQADGEPPAPATRQAEFSISPEKAMIVR